MLVVTLTSKGQTTIPAEVRKKLNLKEGDKMKFEILDNKIILSKIENFDEEYHKTLINTLAEWDSESDDDAYSDL